MIYCSRSAWHQSAHAQLGLSVRYPVSLTSVVKAEAVGEPGSAWSQISSLLPLIRIASIVATSCLLPQHCQHRSQGEQTAAVAQAFSAGKAEGGQQRGSRFTKFFKSEAEASSGAAGVALVLMRRQCSSQHWRELLRQHAPHVTQIC